MVTRKAKTKPEPAEETRETRELPESFYEAADAAGEEPSSVLVGADPAPAPMPDRTPAVTIERAFVGRTKDPIIAAFVHVERLTNRDRIRKLPKAAWDAELSAFVRKER